MVLIFVMKEFDKELTHISELVQKLESNSYELEQESVNLLHNLEKKAEKYSLPIQPKLALIRGKLLCGYKESSANPNRKERNQEKKRFVITQLSEAAICVEEYFAVARKQFDECEQICGQIITHAYSRGLQADTTDLFKMVSTDSELSVPLANVIAIIGTVNARIIFEQAQVYVQ